MIRFLRGALVLVVAIAFCGPPLGCSEEKKATPVDPEAKKKQMEGAQQKYMGGAKGEMEKHKEGAKGKEEGKDKEEGKGKDEKGKTKKDKDE
jgi:hypothetical protein